MDRGNWGQDLALCEYCGGVFGLYLDVTYKDVDHFRKGSVHELSCLKDSHVSKVYA